MARADDSMRRAGGHFSGDPNNDISRHISLLLRPFRRGLLYCFCQLVKPCGVARNEVRVIQFFIDHDVTHGHQHRQVAARFERMPFIRLAGEDGQTRVEADHFCALFLRHHQFMRFGNLNSFIKVVTKRDHITGIGDIHGQIAAHHHFGGNRFSGRACRRVRKGVWRSESRRQLK